MNLLNKLLISAFLFASGLSLAQAQDTHAGHNMAAASGTAATADSMIDGEVRKVNKDTERITIKHGPLPNLDMPGMTMVFRVKDTAMLDQVKEGDKVRFMADKVNGNITLIKLELAPQ